MAQVLFIIAQKNFRDEEFRYPREILKDQDITIASQDVGLCTGSQGMEVYSDINIHDAAKRVEEFDAVIFVGGSGTKAYFDHHAALEIAKKAYDAGKVVAAICAGPVILANAGVLEGKRATSHPGVQDMVKPKCGEYTGDDVTVDGKIVTGRDPLAAKKFGEEILKLL